MVMKEINYISDLSLPNKSAYAVHVMKICDNFAKNGVKVNLNLYSKRKNFNLSKIKKTYLLKKKIKINYCFKEKPKRGLFRNIYFGYWCIKNLQKNSLVLSRSIIPAIMLILMNYKVILEIHHEMSGLTKVIFNFFSKLNFLNKMRFIFIHRNLQKIFDKNKDKSIVLDDCVEIEDFKNKYKVKKRCVYTGSFTKGKGIEVIFKIAKKIPDIQFDAYGNIDTIENLDTKSLKNLNFKNYISYNKIPKVLKSNLILLMPYQKKIGILAKNLDVSKYISPLKLFEYLAASNIIVASKLPVYSHILKNNFNCIMCDPDNIDDWCKSIKNIFKNPKKFEKIKKNSFETAKNYTWKIRSNKILKFAANQNLI